MKKILLFASSALAAFSCFAQDDATHVHFVQTADSSRVTRIMQENALGIENVKDVPRFALMGKNDKFYLGLGANVKFVMDYDFGNPIANPNKFAPADIPMTVAPGDKGNFQLSAGQSDFYLNFVALPGDKNQIGLFIDVNFMGTDHAPALHHAYLKYRGFTAGHTLSVFTDHGAEPAAIDYRGPNGMAFMGHPNISYTQKFGKDRLWSAALGLDLPEYSATYASRTAQINQRVPDIPLYIQRSWEGGKSWFRVSAIFRDLYYRNDMANKNVSAFGWGVKASGKAHIVGGLYGMWQAVYGAGIASYIQDLTGKGMDLMPSATDDYKLSPVKTWAAYGTLRYDFSSKVFMNCTYSHVRTYADKYAGGTATWDSSYRYGQYFTTNVFWNITSFAQFGVEYLYGRRVDYSGLQAHDNRFSVMLKVSI